MLGRMRVEMDSRMKEGEETGPVEKAGPIAGLVVVRAVRASVVRVWWRGGMV